MSGTVAPFAPQAGVTQVYDGTPGSTNTGRAVKVMATNEMSVANGEITRMNTTGSVVVKATPGRLCRVIVIATAANASTLHNVATVGAAAAANTILQIPASTAIGTVYNIDVPCDTGIVAAVGASVALTIVYS